MNLFFFKLAWGFGDPHIATLDDLKYTFNGLGEYRLLELKDGSFKFQGRTKKFGANVKATEFSSFAFHQNDTDVIEIKASTIF